MVISRQRAIELGRTARPARGNSIIPHRPLRSKKELCRAPTAIGLPASAKHLCDGLFSPQDVVSPSVHMRFFEDVVSAYLVSFVVAAVVGVIPLLWLALLAMTARLSSHAKRRWNARAAS